MQRKERCACLGDLLNIELKKNMENPIENMKFWTKVLRFYAD